MDKRNLELGTHVAANALDEAIAAEMPQGARRWSKPGHLVSADAIDATCHRELAFRASAQPRQPRRHHDPHCNKQQVKASFKPAKKSKRRKGKWLALSQGRPNI